MAASKKVFDELKWIEEEPLPYRPPIDEFPPIGGGGGGFQTKFMKKLGENIFVPLGLIATTACLTMGLVSMKRGDSHRQQIFMRGRVFFQAFTLAAMTLGIYLSTRRSLPTNKENSEK